MSQLLSLIHETPRSHIDTTIFGNSCKICLLDFIGTDKYFISEFGIVYMRSQVFLNRKNKVYKGYQPLVKMDHKYPYPWVHIKISTGYIWLPVNMLLGWAYKKLDNMKNLIFVSETPHIWDTPMDKYKWIPRKSLEWDNGYFSLFIQSLFDE